MFIETPGRDAKNGEILAGNCEFRIANLDSRMLRIGNAKLAIVL